MITTEQWFAICSFVKEELSKHASFKIFHSDFEKMFNLEKPYYQTMIQMAKDQSPGFNFHSPWKTYGEGEPSDMIIFSRQE